MKISALLVGALILPGLIAGIAIVHTTTAAVDSLEVTRALAASNNNQFTLEAPNKLKPSDNILETAPVVNDPLVSQQWALEKIHAFGLPLTFAEETDITVAVLDTGIDRHHEDLFGKIVDEVNFTRSPTTDDIAGHGTFVAGIIAANRDNLFGISGAASGVRLLNVKVADDYGFCESADLVKGIFWAVDHGAQVINISLEIRQPSPELANAVDYAWSKGVIVIAAAGNDGSQLQVYPAAYVHSLAVAATNQEDKLAPLSNHGDWVDVAAPGFEIWSTLPGNRYGVESGTSFAAAYVSAQAVLLLHRVIDTNGDGFRNDEVRALIEAGCQKVSLSGIGAGRIDYADSWAHFGDITSGQVVNK